MEQYISKSALVAEIERLITELVEEGEDTMFEQGRISAFEDVKVFINHTLEVKEVDLEEEIKSSMNNLCELGCYAQSLLDNPEDYEGFAKPFPKKVDDEIANFAKHFFELGLKAQKEE